MLKASGELHLYGVCVPHRWFLPIPSHPPTHTRTEQPKFVAELFTSVETMGRASPPRLQERRRKHLLSPLPDVSVIFRLRDPTPASGGQTSWFPTYPSPAELIEKRYLQVNKALFFFSPKNISSYTIKSEQLSPGCFCQVELLLVSTQKLLSTVLWWQVRLLLA